MGEYLSGQSMGIQSAMTAVVMALVEALHEMGADPRETLDNLVRIAQDQLDTHDPRKNSDSFELGWRSPLESLVAVYSRNRPEDDSQ
jgi:hypothetical protein